MLDIIRYYPISIYQRAEAPNLWEIPMLRIKRLHRNRLSIMCVLQAVRPTLNKHYVWSVRGDKGLNAFLEYAELTTMHNRDNGKNKIISRYFNFN